MLSIAIFLQGTYNVFSPLVDLDMGNERLLVQKRCAERSGSRQRATYLEMERGEC